MVYFPTWKKLTTILIILMGIWYALPNFFSEEELHNLPSWMPKDQVNLGLDLQGGSHLLLEIGLDEIEGEFVNITADAIRTTLASEKIRVSRPIITGRTIRFTLPSDKIDAARKEIRDMDPLLGLDIDGRQLSVEIGEDQIRQHKEKAVQQSIEIVRRRIDETGTREPTIQRQGESRIIVQLPGVSDPARIKSLLGQTARMTFHMVDDNAKSSVTGRVKPGYQELPAADQGLGGAPRTNIIHKRILVNGENLKDAQATFQQGEPVVSMRFDAIGTKRFADATKKYVGRRFAIVLDGKIISAPVIREPILTGSGVISGGFTTQEAQDMSLLLRAGALPAPLNILEERSVGPGLGKDSVMAGEFASLMAFSLVLIFMAIIYKRFGLYADIALLINMVLIFGALSAVGGTLTLPGIAGIVLTIGMAVDANVLIFQRIKEEAAKGRTPISAIDIGYKQATVAIFDANLTTFICALLLYVFGTGPVRGFAVTLIFGLATSIFCALMVTRYFIIHWLRTSKPKEIRI